MSKSHKRNQRPELLPWAFGAAALIAGGCVEYVVASFTHAEASNNLWGIALVVVSAVLCLVGTFGLIIVGYLVSRGTWGRAFIPLVCVLGCLTWSWWQLSGAMAKGDEEHRAAKARETEEVVFATDRLAAANAAIKELDAEEKSIDVSRIIATAQASLDAETERRTAERKSLRGERSKLAAVVAGSDPEKDALAIAAAQRRLRAIDGELAQLMSAETVAEPFKAAEVEIEARKAGIATRRARAEAERATHLPVVAKGEAGTFERSPENMGLAALILALIVMVGSGFQLPARTAAETRKKNKAKDDDTNVYPWPWPQRRQAQSA